MVYRGHVKDGVVVLDGSAQLPEGAAVHVVLADADEAEDRAWPHLAAASFAKDWDNDQDAVYDDWRERYRVPGDAGVRLG